VVGNAPTPQGLSQIGGALPIVTNTGDQTKNHVVLHVSSPTKPYRILCSRCEHHWCIWLGAGGLTIPYQLTVLAVDQYKIVLPIITGRGVKYTHNDIKHRILHPDSGPTRIRLVPTEHTHEAIAPPHPTIQRAYRVKSRRSSPHDHSERLRLPRYCVRSKQIW
jgi:hypothetical protein